MKKQKSPQLQSQNHQFSEYQHHNQLSDNSPNQPDHHNLLEYYKSKIDSLYQERLSWLSKFDQCKSKLSDKHSIKSKLLSNQIQNKSIHRSIVHHQIALLDEKLNVIRMDKQNLIHDYRDAQEVVKIADIIEQHPQKIQNMVSCHTIYNSTNQRNGSVNNRLNTGQLIKNQLNIHTSKQKKSAAQRSSKKQPPNSFNIKHSLSQKNYKQYDIINHRNHNSSTHKNQPKISQQELLQRQIIEIQQNDALELQTMKQLKCKLQQLIKKTKMKEKQKLNQEREIVKQINQQFSNLQKKHKELAEQYFTGRRQQKVEQQQLIKQKQDLLQKNELLQQKVNKQLKVYQKQNKAKQILILKKSQDFQQNYKAKMRAKQKNLQALKQNYQKMQNICIEKVTKLQNALNRAKAKLKQAEERKQFLVDELRQQLHTLQKRVQEQKLQRQQRQLKIKLRVEKQKLKNQQQKEKRQRQHAKAQRNRLIQQSYKRTTKKPIKSLSKDQNTRSKKSLPKAPTNKSNVPKKDIYGKPGEQSEEDDSLQMDDLENIRRQIGQLQNKIASDTK